MKSKQSKKITASYGYDLQTEAEFYVNENGRLFMDANTTYQEVPAFDFLCTVNRNLHNYASAAPSRMGLNKIACFSY